MIKTFTFLHLFSLSLLAATPFSITPEEINKKGLYIIEQSGIPKHNDYLEIYRHGGGKKPPLDPTRKFFLTKVIKPKWQVYVPETYNPSMPAGILYFAVITGPGLPSIEQEIEKCKELIKSSNLILISIEAKHPDFNNPNPNFITHYSSEYSMLSRRAIDLIKERYKIDTERVFHYSGGISYSLRTVITCPKTFRYNIFKSVPDASWYEMAFKGKKFPTFGLLTAPLTTLKEAAKNKYAFLYDQDSLELDPTLNKGKKHYTDYGFNNISYYKFPNNHPTNKDVLAKGLELVDPKPFNPQSFLKQASTYTKKKHFAKAYDYYKVAANYDIEEASEIFKQLQEKLNSGSQEMTQAHNGKDFFTAYKMAKNLLHHFGQKHATKAASIYQKYSKDKKIAMEIKAAEFLLKAEAALNKDTPPLDKIKAACEKVLKICPNTVTAQKAQEILTSIQ